jgi:membrane protease subunit HflK
MTGWMTFENPWNQRPNPRPSSPIDSIWKQWVNPPGRGENASMVYIAILASLFMWLASGFFVVEQDEEAVVLRFGSYSRSASPGLNYRFPSPIERSIIEKVTRIEREEIGFRSTSSALLDANGARITQREVPEESLMLTGDENMVDINFEVQWRIRDLKQYLFSLYRPKETVKNAAESAMREVIGNTPIAASLAEGRSSIELKSKELLQGMLDSYASGVEIVRLQMLKVDPPSEVVDAFRDVQTARADKEREINQSQAYQNDIIPRARGDAERIIQEAEAYKQEVVARATGEAERFISIYQQYKTDKAVTAKRLYLEAMESVLSSVDKTIIDGKASQSVVPYLPLPAVQSSRMLTGTKTDAKE